jgi:hypothetical protein
MGFSFRRSSSFGPLRFNFSKSGVGASIGVKGARVTLTPKGRTYITVGAGGFSYRQNLNAGHRSSPIRPQLQPVQTAPVLDEIKTADVEELRESSKSDLVEDLNRRAAMFNPAIILFLAAGLVGLIGMVNLTSSRPATLPVLPEITSDSESTRQANTTDEYALLVARYGEPSTVQAAQVGSTPVRNATWDGAHLTVRLVPAGCVDALRYFEAHKDDPPPIRVFGRHRNAPRTEMQAAPTCNPGASKASTIVAYEDAQSHTSIDAISAAGSLAGISNRSGAPPVLNVSVPTSVKGRVVKGIAPPQSLEYDQTTFQKEEQRLRDLEVAGKQDQRIGTACLAGAMVFLIPGVLVHRKNREKRTTQLIYDLSDSAKAQQEEVEGSLGHLGRSGAIWRLDSQSAITDWKRNAGAAYNVQRERISLGRSSPARVESNVVPLCLDLGKLKLFFLPDQLLYWQRGTFASIEYGDLKVASASTRFIEESVQTSDSQQVGNTWRYVRKDGGPDRRFNNNRQLPIMLYGVVHATSPGGLNLVFHTSRPDSASSFQTTFEAFQLNRGRNSLYGQATESPAQNSNSDHSAAPSLPVDIVQAMSVLGLQPGCTAEEIVAAYRHMAQMYHPDKTMGLGPELQKLADQRMKEINAAHQTVRRYIERNL